MKKTSKKNKVEKEKLLTRSEAATRYDVSLVTIDNWRRRGAPTRQSEDGKTELFPEYKLEMWLIFYNQMNEDPDFKKMINGKLDSILDEFKLPHMNVLAWVTLRNHHHKKQIKDCLLQISTSVEDIHNLAGSR